ncbi:cysteine desulfurase [Spiroplasma gladiatoris]|uniref:cysteine desulfurase n=1 Tax=Spiroplasma gladiatoris TaxID=2143 RepID=A0A4P7AHR7_9MOLU|nr:cysteine desulfurase [Spiroplasma gladiatoris]QBQ07984.1 cysteine desulfurase [Spiroplasma gladiatoris]
MNYKNLFPYFDLNPNDIYFDSAATTLKPKVVLDAEYEYNVKIGANSHNNLFKNAYIANQVLEEARRTCAKFINENNSEQIIFTSGTTHSLNQIVSGLKKHFKENDEVVLTELEHSSNLLPWKVLEKENKINLKYFNLNDNGSINIDKLKNSLSTKTKLVSFASNSNTMGTFNDIQKISKIIKAFNNEIIIIVDCAQSVSHHKIDVKQWNVDFIAFSAHKMYGPFGLGVLWGKKNLLELLEPIFYGGGNNSLISHNEFRLAKLPMRLEAGTLNLSAIYGFKTAIEFIENLTYLKINEHLQNLKNYFIDNLDEIEINKFNFYNLNNNEPIILFNLKNVNAQDFGSFLNKKYNILVRVGKHCARLSNEFLKEESTIRISFGIYNTIEDIKKLIIALKDADSWIEEIL